MIKIKRNKEELIVTKGAFEEIFKPLGYKKVEDKKPKMSYVIPKKVEKPIESDTHEEYTLKRKNQKSR